MGYEDYSYDGGKGLFYDCPLETIYLGRNISYETQYFYGYSPFYNKEELKSLTIGNSVTKLVDYAFRGCDGLISIYLTHATLPSVSKNAFTDTNYTNTTLYVPQSSLTTYQSSQYWKHFLNIEEYNSDRYFYINYIVDGEPYVVDSVKQSHAIILKEIPIREGYTFSGWSEVPTTMPAENITVEGSFSVNSYIVTYIVDGETYATDSIAYGSEITLRDEPVKEGYTFSGWSEVPTTMPAENITVEGSFSVNSYIVTYIVDGETYATDSIAYGSEITLRDEPVKEGYTFSGWSEAPTTMPANDVVITGSFFTTSINAIYINASVKTNKNGIILIGANNSRVTIYSANGTLIANIDSYTGKEIILGKGVYIVQVGNKTMKVKL